MTTGLPAITTTTGGLPKLVTTGAWTTPLVSVPPSQNNPYIYHTNRVNGTVFIAFGSIVGVIILAFIGFHVVRSLLASSTAKKNKVKEKAFYDSYNANTKGRSGTEYQPLGGSISPMGGKYGNTYVDASVGDYSSLYNGSQVDNRSFSVNSPAMKADVTKMFVSPTADIMNHKRGLRPNPLGSNVSLTGGYPGQRSSYIPSIYMNEELSESQPSIAPMSSVSQNINNTFGTGRTPTTPRKAVPSMYLDDLLEK
ncbi:hypothetical protein BABINDRAFT_161564 [Babjeviella inositovora NRRL Y-12698]|uniref:Uncharacterized protein n=1 Tax=Babjeviella inositovora NRRL Y-12698 TaxID=984486 RepID=A0A1E3QQX2_9ASCO|nr:uncharacterized protein BABINDRAFT_161564 [Babjeviella inositovora NRRL Y-12698]ODQ79894.1 hypothetical protein BABINDRAFT_161564 [Babjeviella inositovora NRRL Y-12698]